MTKVDLQRVLDLDAQATAGPWMPCGEDYMARLTNPIEDRHVLSTDEVTPQDAALIAYYRTAAPAMAKAVRAVLDLHVMYWDGSRQEYVCRACQNPARWPTNTCPTVQPIYEHLGGPIE